MQIVPNPEMKERTTLRIGGRAQLELRVQEEADWEEIPGWMDKEGVPPLVLGNGSNLLVQDGDLPLLLIKDCRQREVEAIEHDRDRVQVVAATACSLPVFLSWLQRRGISGLEGLVGIPGSLGGAIAMNAGSFGQEIGNAISRVRMWTPEKGIFWMDRDAIHLGNREFDPGIKEGLWIITRVELQLHLRGKKEILQSMRENYRRKKGTQPVRSHTCGCVFKNPDTELPAGYLLDSCGLKGYTCGSVAFSDLHANFMINTGGGKSAEALELIRLAREKVYERFNTRLQTEVEIVGC
ncbi:MAG: UDP-N-acetylmuramate dehydrogenase [Thermodesulfobacteriota bacterium]